MKKQPWVDRFTGLSQLQTELRQRLSEGSSVIAAPKGAILFGPGRTAENMLFLLSGTARVQQVSESGREIVLYRIEAGQSCVLTTACLLAHEEYAAEGIAETDIQAAAVPRALFDELIAQSQGFRDFVFAMFSKRITGLFHMIDEVAFQRIDVRLAHKLLELSGGVDRIETTHQKLSAELGTAREVISRQLQEFQRRGWILQSRGTVQILDRTGLAGLTA